jgi:hypothetical protein
MIAIVTKRPQRPLRVKKKTRVPKDPYIRTSSSQRFFVTNPEKSEIKLEDIAHGLSMLCRYNGQCSQFYSVAQHSLIIASKVSKKAGMYALLHDASEAYLGDVTSPLKHSESFTLYRELEKRTTAHILKSLNVPCTEAIKKEVAYWDHKILVPEMKHLFFKVKPQKEYNFKPEVPLQFKNLFIETFLNLKGQK